MNVMGELQNINSDLLQLLISVVFSFLIGLEIYTKATDNKRKHLFGSERTFAFISLLGFILLKAESILPHAYLAGLAVISLLLLVYYFKKQNEEGHYGITTITLCLLVYTFPVVVQLFPIWFAMLIIVAVMVLVEIKKQVKEFAQKLFLDDFLTLAKFVFLSFVILPLVPDKEIIQGIPVSPYKLWLAIVAISAISYLSYILRKFVFPKAGLLLTGILGGLYSSTATTFILAKKSKEQSEAPCRYAAAILSATILMFARIYLLVIIFNPPLSIILLPYFIILISTSSIITFFIYRASPNPIIETTTNNIARQNPLELQIALVFGILYIVFSVLTQYTINYFGGNGLTTLSFIVGVTDIDPFLLNLFQGKYAGISLGMMGIASMHAIASNNILKMVYAIGLGDKGIRKYILLGFGAIIICNIVILFFI